MRTLKVIKIVIVVAIIYNAWLLLVTPHIQTRFMRNVSYLNYHADLYNEYVAVLFPTLNLISGWILFFVCAMQCSVVVILITTSMVPYVMTSTALFTEGIVSVAMGEAGVEPQGAENKGWGLIVAGLGLWALREREIQIRRQYAKKVQAS